MTSNPWQVQILGWATDLEHLERHFSSTPQRVVKGEDGNSFLYESDSFTELTDSGKVLECAKSELHVLSGVLKLARNSPTPLRAGAVFKFNEASGQKDTYLHLSDSMTMHAEIGELTVTITDASGNSTIQALPPPRTVGIAQLATGDSSVAKAMRLLASPTHTSWVEMYRIYEVVEDDMGGQHRLAKRGWGSEIDLKRFKHSANSVAVGGDGARHGKELTVPPPKPMSPDEAAAYLNYVLQSWLSLKLEERRP